MPLMDLTCKAVDYLLKPISYERLLQAIHKYLKENIPISSESKEELVLEKSDFIFVRSDRKMVKMNFSDIFFIESLGDYLKINLEDKIIITKRNHNKHRRQNCQKKIF